MEELLEAIRSALAPDASNEMRANAAAACRGLLAQLEPSAPTTAGGGNAPALPIAELAAAIRGIPMEQLLDVAIGRLRAALPEGMAAPEVRRLQFPILPVPQGGGVR